MKKMTTQSNVNKRDKKPLLIGLVFIACCILGYMTYSSYHKNNKPGKTDKPTSEQLKQSSRVEANTKKEYVEKSDNTLKPDGTSSTPPTSTTATIDLTVKRETNNSVTVIAKILGVPSGTCNLEIKNGAKTVVKTADIIYQSEFSTCAGFSIPTSELSSGTWVIRLFLSNSPLAGSKTTNFVVE